MQTMLYHIMHNRQLAKQCNTKELNIIAGSGTGKTLPITPSVYLNFLNGATHIVSDPHGESLETLRRYLSLSPADRIAEYASNNWRRMHGYPLRRGIINKRHKDRIQYSMEAVWWRQISAMEKAGYSIKIMDITETKQSEPWKTDTH